MKKIVCTELKKEIRNEGRKEKRKAEKYIDTN